MGRHDGGDISIEWIQDGEAAVTVAPAGPGRKWRRWYPPLIAVTVVIVVVALLSAGQGKPTTPANPIPAPVTPAPRVTAATAAPMVLPVETTDVGRPLLAVPADWELFGRGREVVRIQLRGGRVTRTAVPQLQSTGPVYFLVGADRAIVRPLDSVPGYLVPDGRPATALNGLLGEGGPVLAGPDTNHLWRWSRSASQAAMQLVSLDGTPTGVSIPVGDGFPVSDGTGYLLVNSTAGVYLARPEGLTRVTTGSLLAAGPTRWLTVECDVHQRCNTVVTDRATGLARPLGPSDATPGGFPPGVVSPDGGTAAFKGETATSVLLHLLDLRSGQDHIIDARLGPPGDGDMVWTPDSRLLFLVDRDGHLDVIDAPATRLGDLGVVLPAINQIALRVGPKP